jgi:hypothetical protein
VRLTLCTLVTLFFIVVACQGAGPVSLKSRSGYVGSAGQRFRFSIGIEPDIKNRLFCLEWASPSFSGSSCDTLEGDKAPRTRWREITFRRGGEFNVIVWIRQNDDKIIRSNIETIIIMDALGQ